MPQLVEVIPLFYPKQVWTSILFVALFLQHDTRGSTVEADNWIIKCGDLKFLDKKVIMERQRTCEEIRLMLNAFLRTFQN
ncbi:MAG: hypothetical protein AB1567_13600 [bacterium]